MERPFDRQRRTRQRRLRQRRSLSLCRNAVARRARSRCVEHGDATTLRLTLLRQRHDCVSRTVRRLSRVASLGSHAANPIGLVARKMLIDVAYPAGFVARSVLRILPIGIDGVWCDALVSANARWRALIVCRPIGIKASRCPSGSGRATRRATKVSLARAHIRLFLTLVAFVARAATGHLGTYPVVFDLLATTATERALAAGARCCRCCCCYDTTTNCVRVAEAQQVLTKYICANDYKLIGPDGPTRWGNWNPKSLNDDPMWEDERGLNSAEMVRRLCLRRSTRLTCDPCSFRILAARRASLPTTRTLRRGSWRCSARQTTTAPISVPATRDRHPRAQRPRARRPQTTSSS